MLAHPWSTLVLGAALGAAAAAYCASPSNPDAELLATIAELETKLEKETKLRAQERLGRTNAERDARLIAQQQLDRDGYNFEPIGSVESCFADRRGTPRQGALVPASKGRIRLVTSVPPASLECLDQFSHVWVLFVFHENTNVSKVAANKKTTYPAKIAPPRLGGKKVGLFSTRTPHRPNSIGLTVVKLDAVYDRTIEISGHDFVHGTPILDVKPYVPYDRVDDLECPEWVMERHDILPRPVEFADEALAQLEAAINSKRLEFYHSVDELKDAIAQILVLDIRSVHQKRGEATEALFSFRLDKLRIEFATLEASIRVVQCAFDTI
ncbi:hypothetical protein SDRG_13862 [Saprolegnia diclina VS20]|uniref:TsaA-like domain-containing protein n=1 Tax=Saprolegnia diclina (strain VS20) TaxID=1156394 RepID=T0PS40_SAPDV|nr:hypothetical protein SDRG_13862 [Saprolegnia diclina VS20]EQC28314.1 hypothetical protein SDRG_13862 [Saprolegnia diclina VS20]|eukprot:XP_008618184.1 hypothetical protein SDRG_13862 [Saprolegnia diclina VS20]